MGSPDFRERVLVWLGKELAVAYTAAELFHMAELARGRLGNIVYAREIENAKRHYGSV